MRRRWCDFARHVTTAEGRTLAMEDATWGLQQRFHLEQFLVRSWRTMRRQIALVPLGFKGLNLYGDDRFQPLREAFLRHRWRFPKPTTSLLDWLASQIHLTAAPQNQKSPKSTMIEVGVLQ